MSLGRVRWFAVRHVKARSMPRPGVGWPPGMRWRKLSCVFERHWGQTEKGTPDACCKCLCVYPSVGVFLYCGLENYIGFDSLLFDCFLWFRGICKTSLTYPLVVLCWWSVGCPWCPPRVRCHVCSLTGAGQIWIFHIHSWSHGGVPGSGCWMTCRSVLCTSCCRWGRWFGISLISCICFCGWGGCFSNSIFFSVFFAE